jgi:hypothetical protein
MNNNHDAERVLEYQNETSQELLGLNLLDADFSSANEHFNQMYFL